MARRLPSPRLGSEEHAGPKGRTTPGAVLGRLGDGDVEAEGEVDVLGEAEVEGDVLGEAEGEADVGGEVDGDVDSAADVEVSGDGVTARAWGACSPRVTGRAAASAAATTVARLRVRFMFDFSSCGRSPRLMGDRSWVTGLKRSHDLPRSAS
ncbi:MULTISPECIES: hypothetical protein [unclassified Streptomyces]|uniref:hypothetical protein n=1 Tax=unclassified Streptomyces TaxID=2593676 RepID=UPI00380BD460